MKESTFCKVQKYFWWAYVLLPLFTGFLSYDWLPDESYDERKHELLTSYTVDTNPVGGSEEAPREWRSKTSGETYSRDTFSKHRHSEAIRVSVSTFLYGLIGCFVFAYGQVIKKRESFIDALKSSLFYDVAASVITLFFIW